MRKLDFRSLIVGLSVGIYMFLSMGQNNRNMGDITVSSISIMNGQNEVAWIGANTDGGGQLTLNNGYGVENVELASTENSGHLRTFNAKGKETVILGTAVEGFGYMRTFNNYDKVTSYVGTNVNEDGIVVIYDKYENFNWGQTASR